MAPGSGGTPTITSRFNPLFDDDEEDKPGWLPARITMWALLGSTSLSFMLTRLSLPQLIPLLAADLKLTEAQTGLLLGSFFPGYVIGMTPSGILCRLFGAKNVLSVGLLGNAAAMALLPFAAARSVPSASAVLVFKGLCQSCLESTHTTLKRVWMPSSLGNQRVYAMRVTRWGQFLGQMAASLATPLIAARLGWRAVPLAEGGVTALWTLIWHTLSAESPAEWRGPPRMSTAERRLLLSDGTTAQPTKAEAEPALAQIAEEEQEEKEEKEEKGKRLKSMLDPNQAAGFPRSLRQQEKKTPHPPSQLQPGGVAWSKAASADMRRRTRSPKPPPSTPLATAPPTSASGPSTAFPFHLLRYPSCVVPMMLHVANNCSQCESKQRVIHHVCRHQSDVDRCCRQIRCSTGARRCS